MMGNWRPAGRALEALLPVIVCTAACNLPYPADVASADGGTGADTAVSDAKACTPLLAFSGTNAAGHQNIFTVTPDGSKLTNVTMNDTGDDTQPVWSPDGQYIAFTSTRTGHHHVCVIRSDGGSFMDITPGNAEHYNAPSWSPNSTEIAYETMLSTSVNDIFIANRDGSNPQDRTGATGENVLPNWSADGQKVAFVSNRVGGMVNIFVMAMNGSGITPITSVPGSYLYPKWSPDGTKILYLSLDTNATYVMSATGANSKMLGATDGASTHSWSHAGDRIAFHDGDIYTVLPDGTKLKRITFTGDGCNPDWSPDDTTIAYNTGCLAGGRQIMLVSSTGGNPMPVLAGESPVWQPMCQ